MNNFHSQLQVALYCRHELNIRSTTSLILAFASIHQPCRPFLFRYFSKAIVLPTDWTSVADLVQTFDSQLNAGSLPAILRKCKHNKIQCENLKNFLWSRFYVKSKPANLIQFGLDHFGITNERSEMISFWGVDSFYDMIR